MAAFLISEMNYINLVRIMNSILNDWIKRNETLNLLTQNNNFSISRNILY